CLLTIYYILFSILLFFFFTATATSEIYTLSLHDALPISFGNMFVAGQTGSTDFPTSHPLQSTLNGRSDAFITALNAQGNTFLFSDRKSTRLNSSHVSISYAVFCLKKKKKIKNH